MSVSRHHRCQIEAEAIYVHLHYPMTQTIHDQTPDDRVIGIDRIAASAIVSIAGHVLPENIVGQILQSSERLGRSGMVALGGMIKDHVQYDLNARPVQGLDHIAELAHRRQGVGAGAVALMRRKERHGRIAPVVGTPGWGVLWIELLDRQEFHRRDSQRLEIWDFLDQASVGTPFIGRNARTGMSGKAPDVEFIDHGAGIGQTHQPITLPVVGAGIYHHPLHRVGTIVTGTRSRFTVIVRAHCHRAGIGVQQHLLAIKPEPTLRRKLSMGAVSVQLPGTNTRQKDVPVIERSVLFRIQPNHTSGLGGVGVVEQQQLDRFTVLGKDGKVDALGINGRAQGKTRTRQYV